MYASKLSRMKEYVWLRDDFTLSQPEIAKRIGISTRTADRYRKELIALGVLYPRASGIIMNMDKHRERVRNMPRHPDGRFI